jgi:hypothetical protein
MTEQEAGKHQPQGTDGLRLGRKGSLCDKPSDHRTRSFLLVAGNATKHFRLQKATLGAVKIYHLNAQRQASRRL